MDKIGHILGSAKKGIQKAAKEYFRYTLPNKIIESICDKHPDIIKETQVILDGLNHRWSSKETFLSLTLFRKISNHWIQELLDDPLVKRLASSAQHKMVNIVDLNQEYIFFLMLANFLVPKTVEEQVTSLVAYTFIDGKFIGQEEKLAGKVFGGGTLYFGLRSLLQNSKADIVRDVSKLLRKSRETKRSLL